jgi:ketosteroid isomerase-like protein
MRTLFTGGALAIAVVSLAACGSGGNSGSEQSMQRDADRWAIDQIEKSFHKATSRHDIDLMMSLWASNATLTIPGQTAVGRKQIRQYFVTKAKPFAPASHWISETPAYKIRISVNGDRGTLYFECHYVDIKTEKLLTHTAADLEVARINGRWLITSMVGGTAALSS